jgi:hypothetical protein
MLPRAAALLLAFSFAGPPTPTGEGGEGGEVPAETGEVPATGVGEFDPAPPLWDLPGGFWLSVEMLGPRGAQLDAARSLAQPPVIEALPRGGAPPPGELVGRVETLEQALAWVAANCFAPIDESPDATPIPGGRLLAEFELVQTALVITGQALNGTTPYAWPPAVELPVPDTWQGASLTVARAPVFAAPAPTHPPAAERYRVATIADAIWLLGTRDSCQTGSSAAGRATPSLPHAQRLTCLHWAQVVVRQGDRFFGGWIPASQVVPDSAWIGGPGERRFALLPGHRTPSEAGFVLHEQRVERREPPLGLQHPYVPEREQSWPPAGIELLGEDLIVLIGGEAKLTRHIEVEPLPGP